MAAKNGIGARFMLCAAVLWACAAHSQSPVAGTAQAYPAKPIRIIVPFTPGTGIDILARTAAQKLNERWGQGIVIDLVRAQAATSAMKRSPSPRPTATR